MSTPTDTTCIICNENCHKLNILAIHLKKFHKMTSQEYYDENFKKAGEGTCKSCSKETNFRGFSKGYRTYCDSKCSNSNKEKIDKTKKNLLEKYGDQNYNNREKSNKTKKDRYNDENYNNSKQANKTKLEVDEMGMNSHDKALIKCKSTKLDLYGDEFFVNREQAIETKLDLYGDKNYNNPSQIVKTKLEDIDENGLNSYDRIVIKSMKTKEDLYEDKNYNNPEKNRETKLNNIDENGLNSYDRWKVSYIETMNLKYGVDNSMQVPEFHEKNQKSGFKWKEYKFPSNKIVKVQGYEPQALDILLESYHEDEIEVSRKKIPSIWYYTEDEKKHRYYPDIYIEKDNLIIEVKSLWTYNKYNEINLLKQKACIEAGYNFKFMILDGKSSVVDL